LFCHTLRYTFCKLKFVFQSLKLISFSVIQISTSIDLYSSYYCLSLSLSLSSGYRLGPLDPLRGLKCNSPTICEKKNIQWLHLLFTLLNSAESPLSSNEESKKNYLLFISLDFFAVDHLSSHLSCFFFSFMSTGHAAGSLL
jgi:hypothetical protein